MKSLKFTVFVFLLLALSLTVLGQNKLPGGVEKVTSVEGITEYRLPNGLKILLFPDQTKQTITVNVTYLVGSRHENYGETGMAHLLEHLVFKGTPKHPNIPAELTTRGARPNGTTCFDRRITLKSFAATDENLELGIGSGSRPDGQFVYRQKGFGIGIFRRSQRIRVGRKLPVPRFD